NRVQIDSGFAPPCKGSSCSKTCREIASVLAELRVITRFSKSHRTANFCRIVLHENFTADSLSSLRCFSETIGQVAESKLVLSLRVCVFCSSHPRYTFAKESVQCPTRKTTNSASNAWKTESPPVRWAASVVEPTM